MARMLQGGFGTTLGLFFVVIAVLLHGVFLPEQTQFANDGPLGELMAQCHRLPDRFTGCWSDLNSVGFNGGVASRTSVSVWNGYWDRFGFPSFMRLWRC